LFGEASRLADAAAEDAAILEHDFCGERLLDREEYQHTEKAGPQ
jgi:hypothetical protein